jgi:Holliday junction DNA helicase RuvA
MYDYIKGKFIGKSRAGLTVEAGGIGYLLELTARDLAAAAVGGEGKIYTVLLHREDKMSLCGFLQREARDIFNILISVSGVGSKMALTLLDEFDTSELIGLVIEGDFKELTRAKGVGPKLAQKIILELKDKLMNYHGPVAPAAATKQDIHDTQAVEDAQTVLVSLGYNREEIKNAIAKSNSKSSAEEILKSALKILSN